MRYGMVGVALSLMAGIALRSHFPASAVWIWGGSALFCLGACMIPRIPRGLRVGLVMMAVAGLGMLRTPVGDEFSHWLLQRVPGIEELHGTVVSYPDLREDAVSFTLEPLHLPGRLVVFWRTENPTGAVHWGDQLIVRGAARLPKAFDGFDYPAYLARRGIVGTFFADEVVPIASSTKGRSLFGWGDRLRQQIVGGFRRTLPVHAAALAQSLLLGDRSALDEATEDAFSRTGLMHLLAVSGLHLGIFLAGAWWCLRRLGLRPRITYPLVGLLVGVVLALVGPRVSLVRAALLFAFLGLGSVLADYGIIARRWIRPLNGLAVAVIVLLLLRPGTLYEAGFQLTVSATASILIALSLCGWGSRMLRSLSASSRKRPIKWLLQILVVSAAAQAGAAPIIAWHFGTFHPMAILLNPLVVPWAAASLWAGLLSIPWLGTSFSMAAAWPFMVLIRGLGGAVALLAAVPGMAFVVTPSMAGWMGGWLSIILLADYALFLSSRTSKSTSMMSDDGGG